MSVFPVIMCGGAGTRLWPASRPSRPKQFLPLIGKRSLFQDTVLRVSSLIETDGQLIVVAGKAHEALVRQQLSELGKTAQIILEPQGRDSAPAMAAAALWTLAIDPDGVNVFVSSDHFLPDHDAFVRASLEAAKAAAKGKIITLGVRPTSASSAYGYIEPASKGLSDVKRFVEKPTADVAVELVANGFMWNTGIFVARSETLVSELNAHAPNVCRYVSASLPADSGNNPIYLTQEFIKSPKISIDYAVMEVTDIASVLPVSFEWSDLGAWDAVADKWNSISSKHILKDSSGSMIYAPSDRLVSVVGVKNVAVVVEDDAVLVCDLSKSQDVKNIVSLVSEIHPQFLDFTEVAVKNSTSAIKDFIGWVEQRALPIWATLGVESGGIFSEELTYDGGAVESDHRLRVQARQLFVFSSAGMLGWRGPWKNLVEQGLDGLKKFEHANKYPYAGFLTSKQNQIDIPASVYDSAFVIFALSNIAKSGFDQEYCEARSFAVLDYLSTKLSPSGAYIEDGGHPFQSNAHMHLLEASLSWEQVSDDPRWKEVSDRIVNLCRSIFVDPQDGALREFFTGEWKRSTSEYGKRVEPGHQFEWAWLLSNYAEMRSSKEVMDLAYRLYDVGCRGVFKSTGVLADVMSPEGAFKEESARLWPQTEWLRAALKFARISSPERRERYLADVSRALTALDLYLLPNGLWRDQLVGQNRFAITNTKASSFYHIMGVYAEARLAVGHAHLAKSLDGQNEFGL